MKTVQHLLELFRTDGDHQRQANGAIIGIAPANPVPEDEPVFRVDAELPDLFGIGGNGYAWFWVYDQASLNWAPERVVGR